MGGKWVLENLIGQIPPITQAIKCCPKTIFNVDLLFSQTAKEILHFFTKTILGTYIDHLELNVSHTVIGLFLKNYTRFCLD